MGHALKMRNRIRELRTARKWSMRALADKVNTTGSNINKLEKGHTVLDVKWIERLAKAFGVPPGDIIIGDDKAITGFREEIEPYDFSQSEMPKIELSDTQFCYTCSANVLDQIGIVKGDILVIDMSKEAMAELSMGDVVIAQLYDGDRAKTILRQFIEPSLLITNSAGENAPVINLRMADVAVKGVLVGSYSHFQKKSVRHAGKE